VIKSQPNKKQVIFFPQAKINFSRRFLAANYDSVFNFFPARQVSEIILNDHSFRAFSVLLENSLRIISET
jgi:hypothetical protein